MQKEKELVKKTIDAMITVRNQNKEKVKDGEIEVTLSLANDEILAMLNRRRMTIVLRKKLIKLFSESNLVEVLSSEGVKIVLRTLPNEGQRTNFGSLQDLLSVV